MHKYRLGIRIISFLIILNVLISFCNDLVAEPAYTRLMLHEMYDKDDNYSMAFLGASHVYQSFDPRVFDEEVDKCNSINLGSSGQSLAGSFFLLREFLKKNKPDVIIMEITYPSYENVYDRVSVPEYALFDYMKPSLNKLQYFFSVFPKEDYANALFPIYRNRSMLQLLEIKEKYHQKRNSGYYEYKGFGHTDGWQYINKGFVAIDWSYENMDFEIAEPYQWDESLIIEKEVEYLKRLTALCLTEDVDIIWVTAPIPVYSMMWMGNYEEAHDYFKALAKNCDVEYYDFNYCRKEILARNDYLYFYDSSHMNGVYAELFSGVVCQLLEERNSGDIQYDKYFYETYDEMIKECYDASLDMVKSY